MSRILISLAVLLVLASPARAQYTAAMIADCPNDGKGGVCVVYSGTNVKTTEPGDNRYFPRAAADLSFATTARKAELNGLDTTKKVFTVGTVIADAGAPIVVTPPGKTPDELALAAFEKLLRAWGTARAKVLLGMAMDSDVTDAAALVSAAYAASKSQQSAFDDLIWANVFRVGPL